MGWQYSPKSTAAITLHANRVEEGMTLHANRVEEGMTLHANRVEEGVIKCAMPRIRKQQKRVGTKLYLGKLAPFLRRDVRDRCDWASLWGRIGMCEGTN